MMTLEKDNILDKLYEFFQTHKYKRKKYGKVLEKIVHLKNKIVEDPLAERSKTMGIIIYFITNVINKSDTFNTKTKRESFFNSIDSFTISLLELFYEKIN